MPSTTPISRLPYPLGTDLLADGDNAIQALALAIDGSNFVALTGMSAGFTGGLAWARRSNMITLISTVGYTGTTVSNQVIVPIPAAIRPPSVAVPGLMLLVGQSGGAVRSMVITDAGNLLVGEAAASWGCWGTWSWPAN